ncbi:MAG: hypothetical protein AB8C13_04765 [Phycisphaerales bacterium]
MNWRMTARGAADIKLVLAALFAVGGLSWGVVSVLSSGNSAENDSLRVLDTVVDASGNAVEPVYSKSNTDTQVSFIEQELRGVVLRQATSAVSGIDSAKGLPDGVGDAVINAFLPVLTGDHASFIDAIKAMGGVLAGDLDQDHPLFTELTKTFRGAKVDLSRITVEKYVAGETRRKDSRERSSGGVNMGGDDANAEGSQTGVQTNVIEMHPASIFPDAPKKQDPTSLHVKIPVQPKGEKQETIFGLILTWNTKAKQWQPAAYQLIRNRKVQDKNDD